MSPNPFRFGYLAMTPAPRANQWRERARWAEDNGFSTFQVSDHFDRSPAAPLPVLAAAASVTEDIRLGTLVLNNDFRHPAVLAKELATVDVLSDGRLEVGLGAGWMTADYEVSGIVREAAGTRIDRLGETLALLDHVLRADSTVTMSGVRFEVASLQSIPEPIQRPRPRLLVGGGGRRILSLAARTADIVSVNLAVGEGRVGPQAARSAAWQATDEKLGWVQDAAGSRLDSIELHLVIYWARVGVGAEQAALDLIRERGLELTPEELLASPHTLIGPASALVERVHELRERWGFSYLTFYDSDAADLMPVLTALHGN